MPYKFFYYPFKKQNSSHGFKIEQDIPHVVKTEQFFDLGFESFRMNLFLFLLEETSFEGKFLKKNHFLFHPNT